MKPCKTQILLFFVLFLPALATSAQTELPGDSVGGEQILINGRLWRNKHGGIQGDPFLITDGFLSGSVMIGNRTYSPLRIRYDIFSDEIMIPIDRGILQLNKELVDSFTLTSGNRIIKFIRINDNELYPFSGYVQDVYSGQSALYIKYQKKIDRPGIVNVPDNFYQVQRMYYLQDSLAYPVKNKRDFFRIIKEEKAQIKTFMKENRVHLSRKKPESFVPVLKYLDRISM